MGVSGNFSLAFAKGQLAAGTVLPETGKIFLSVASQSAKVHGGFGSSSCGIGL